MLKLQVKLVHTLYH